jgi:hypothetical protein
VEGTRIPGDCANMGLYKHTIILTNLTIILSQDSDGLDGRSSIPDRGKSFSSLVHRVQTDAGAYPTGALSLLVKWAGREADNHLRLVLRPRMVELPRLLHGTVLN